MSDWSKLSLNAKLSMLAGETSIDAYLLEGDLVLMKMLKNGKSYDDCLQHIQNNY